MYKCSTEATGIWQSANSSHYLKAVTPDPCILNLNTLYLPVETPFEKS